MFSFMEYRALSDQRRRAFRSKLLKDLKLIIFKLSSIILCIFSHHNLLCFSCVFTREWRGCSIKCHKQRKTFLLFCAFCGAWKSQENSKSAHVVLSTHCGLLFLLQNTWIRGGFHNWFLKIFSFVLKFQFIFARRLFGSLKIKRRQGYEVYPTMACETKPQC